MTETKTKAAPLATLLRANALAAEYYKKLEARVRALEAAAEGKKAKVRVKAGRQTKND